MATVKKDTNGFYLEDDGIYCDDTVIPAKYRGEDIELFAAYESLCSLEELRLLVDKNQKNEINNSCLPCRPA